MADSFNADPDDDLMFGELPEDDDFNGLGDESEIDANNDETFGAPLPATNTFDELEDYAEQAAHLNMDDIWDVPSSSVVIPPSASELPMPSLDFTNFGSSSFDFLGTDSKKIWGQGKADTEPDDYWPDMPTLRSLYEKEPLVESIPTPPPQSLTMPPEVMFPKTDIPTMPKAPTLEEIERAHAEAAKQTRIPSIPSTAMSAEELEKRMLQESRGGRQSNGTPAQGPIPPLMTNMPPNPVALGICPPILPIFVPCFGPWLDVVTRRSQCLPPGCPPPPPFVLGLMQRFRNPMMVMSLMQSAVTPPGMPPGMPPTFIPPPFSPMPPSHSQTMTPTPGWHHHHRKPPGMPSAKTIEDLAFDQFAGYMSIKERQWLVKIQILQCQGTNNPYEDDYYYLCWRQKKIAEGMQPKEQKDPEKSETKEIINGSRQIRERRNRERNGSTSEGPVVDRVTTLATRFAGSLGIPTKASTHNPRHSIRVQHNESVDEDMEKRAAGHQKKLRTLLIRIETATSLLIECQDRRVALQNPGGHANKETLVAEINEKVATVMKELFQEEFPRVMQVSKGRGLITRIFKVAMPLDICRMIRLLLVQCRVPHNTRHLADIEEDVFPGIYKGLMAFQREVIVAVLQYFKIDDLLAALNEKNTFARDLLLLLLYVCSVKKASLACPLFDWVRSTTPFDLSSGWPITEAVLWRFLSISRDAVHSMASWMHFLVAEKSHGTVASQIAQRLFAY